MWVSNQNSSQKRGRIDRLKIDCMAVACKRSEISSASNPSVDAICGLSMLLVLFLAPRGFSSGYSSFLLFSKPTLSNFNSTWNARIRLKEFLRTILGKQIANYGENLSGFWGILAFYFWVNFGRNLVIPDSYNSGEKWNHKVPTKSTKRAENGGIWDFLSEKWSQVIS